jgi:hypothetical protein
VKKAWDQGEAIQHLRMYKSSATKQGGLCVKHGEKIKVKLCSSEGWMQKQSIRGGVCVKHGAKVK